MSVASAPCEHKVLFFDSDDTYLAGALPFLHQGLAAGDACIVLTDRANESLLRAHLPAAGADVEFGDPAAWYTSSPGAMVATLNRCFADEQQRARRVRILGGVRWDGLDHRARRGWQRYEAVLNTVLAGGNAALLCAYDTRELDDDIVRTARRTHPAVDDAGADRASASYVDPAAFCVECDGEPLPEPSVPVDGMSFDGAALAATRRFTAAHAAAAGLDDDGVGDVVAAVAEVTGNVVRHAGGYGRLRAWREDGQLVIDVRDHGPAAIDPLAGWLPPAAGSSHHFGLWLARQLVDFVETRHADGAQVRLYARAG